MIRRTVLLVLAAALTGLVLAAGAMAYWSATGRGHGLAATGSIPQVTGVVATQASSLEVTWAPVDVPTGVVPTYTVRRATTSTQIVCTTSATTCTLPVETEVAKYSVTAQLNGWTGPESVGVRP
jgi:hypothetical protein